MNQGDAHVHFSNMELRHIVDVDGQLLGFDAAVVDTATLLARANRPAASDLWMVRAGERIAVAPRQTIRLSQDDVLFFESSTRVARWSEPRLLAA